MPLGFHATPRSNLERIRRCGIEAVPFWRSTDVLRKPFKFRRRYDPCVNIVEGRNETQLIDAVYDSIKAAKIHLDGSARGPFPIMNIGLFIVQTDDVEIVERRIKHLFVRFGVSKRNGYQGLEEVEEVRLKAPLKNIYELEISNGLRQSLDAISKGMNWLEANMGISKQISLRVAREIESL